MGSPLIVSLEGLPGSGKTTTAKLVAENQGLTYAHERSADVPFLEDFYSNVERYTFETEICFVLVHYHQYRDLREPTILDFSPVKDVIFADMNLQGEDLELFLALYRRTLGSCERPDVAVFLELETDHLLQRIEKRGREYEKGFDPAYLEALKAAYESRLDQLADLVVKVSVGRADSPSDVASAVSRQLDHP